MENILEALKSRRVWGGIFAGVAIIFTLFGVQVNFNAADFTDAVMKVVDAISGLMALVLPILSYFKPKD